MTVPGITEHLVLLGGAALQANYGQAYTRYNTRSAPLRSSQIVVATVRGQEGWQWEDAYTSAINMAGAQGLQGASVLTELAELVRLILRGAQGAVGLAQETEAQLFEMVGDALKEMGQEEYEARAETEAILSDPETMEALDEAEADIEAGRVYSDGDLISVQVGAKEFAAATGKSLTYVKEHAVELGGVKVGRVWQFPLSRRVEL